MPGKRRTEIEAKKLEDAILCDVIDGLTVKQMMEKHGISERSVYLYIESNKERIVAEQTEVRNEDVLYHKKVSEERFLFSLRIEKELAENPKVPPRTRMDAAMRHAEIAALIFRLQIETGNWLNERRKTYLQVKPLELKEGEIKMSSGGDNES